VREGYGEICRSHGSFETDILPRVRGAVPCPLLIGIAILIGWLVNNNGYPPPSFFVSIDSKELRFSVSRLESTLVDYRVSIDSREFTCSKTFQSGFSCKCCE
jgi:hypothetical protein